MENYVFFIGGTGARVLRSFLHLCASGAVRLDSKINVVMLDVDSENYACTEAKELYDIYRETRGKLNDRKVQDVLKGAVVPAFYPQVEMPSAGAAVISPITNANATLDLAASGSKRALEWFYTEEERNQSLKHGFFAHPNIGCLFFDSVRDALLPHINNIAGTLNSDRDVRVAIVGSMFGGTGAAGIPTVLRILHDECQNLVSSDDKMKRLHFGGVLVTPYFKFKDPSGATGNLHIHHNVFFGNTRSALEYYDWNYKEKFERIYLAGQDILQFVSPNGEYVDGGNKQRNKPHIVELIGAMGVRNFLMDASDFRGSMNIYEMILKSEGRENEPIFGWNTLDAELSAIGDMLRTQTLMRMVIAPCVLGLVSDKWPWFKTFNMKTMDNQAELKAWLLYTDRFLDWIYNIQYQLREPNGDGYARDERISLAGYPIEAVYENGRMDIAKDFAALIQNDTSAVNVTYKYADGKKLLGQLGAMGILHSKYSKLGTPGLFIQLFNLASEKT